MEVLKNTVVRIDFVKWLNAMFKKYPYTNDQLSKKEKLKYYTTTMTSSHDRVNYLYKIQAAYNLRLKISINVKPENEFYNILLRANQLWLDLTLEFVKIFMQTLVTDNSRHFWALPNLSTNPMYNDDNNNNNNNTKGKEIMDLIIENNHFYRIIKQLEDNLKIVGMYIEIYEASENLEKENP